jgi:hypothetical protein
MYLLSIPASAARVPLLHSTTFKGNTHFPLPDTTSLF